MDFALSDEQRAIQETVREYQVARFLGDAKILQIGEGTPEIQRLVIARELGC